MMLFHALVLGDMLGAERVVFAKENSHAKQQYGRQYSYYCQYD